MLDGHYLDVVVNSHSKLKDIGTIACSFTAYIYDEDGNDVTHLYNIEERKPNITIEERTIFVEFESIVHIYDGTFPEITFDNVIGVYNLLSGHILSEFTMTDPYRDCILDESNNIKEYNQRLNSIVVLDAYGNDVTSYYRFNKSKEIDANYINVKIANIDITIKPVDLSKVFDGEELICNEIEIIEGAIPNNHTYDFIIDGTILFPENTVSRIVDGGFVVYNSQGKDVTSYFNVTALTGELIIEKGYVKITSGVVGEYNGSLYQPVFEILDGEIPEQFSYSYTIIGDRVDAGENPSIIISFVITHPMLGDVTNCFDIENIDGLVNISKYPITIKPSDKEKYFDATPLTSNEVEFVDCEILEGYTVVIETSGQPLVGQEINAITTYYVFDQYGNDVTHNFDVTCKYGSLLVHQIGLKLIPRNIVREYSGEKVTISNTGYRKQIIGNLIIDINISLELICSGTMTDKNEDSPSIISVDPQSVVITDAEGNDISYGFDIDTNQTGKLTIYGKELIIKPKDVIGEYNGSLYKPTDYELLDSELCDGHTITYVEYSGSTKYGETTTAIIGIVIEDAEGNDVTDNYDIDFLDGTIKVS